MVKIFTFHREIQGRNLKRKSLDDDLNLHLDQQAQGILLEIHLFIENEDIIENTEDVHHLHLRTETIENEEIDEEEDLLHPHLLITSTNEETTRMMTILIFPVRIETKFQVKNFGMGSNGLIELIQLSERVLLQGMLLIKKR